MRLIVNLFVCLFLHFGAVKASYRERNNADSVWHLDGQIPVTEKCKAFFKAYSTSAGEFSLCELAYAQPFRMCFNCVEKYAITTETYKDLVNDEDLTECRIKYMKSDRVQIIPAMQNNIEEMWKESACAGCFIDLYVNHTTKQVHYDQPESLLKFLDLYNTLSLCMNTTLENKGTDDIVTDVCDVCLKNYTDLNKHYNHMSSEFDGNICMDIVDRMNYTRLMWSHHYDCSYRTSDPVPIIAITVIVSVFPIFFYVILRLTSKEKKKKVVKQKRLTKSGRMTSNSFSRSLWRPSSYADYASLRSTS